MLLELIDPPTEEPVSLAEVKAHLRVLHDDEDEAIERFARAARRAVELRGGVSLTSQGWRLSLDRAPQGVLTLPRIPVFSVEAVGFVGRNGAFEAVSPEHYDLQTGPAGRLALRGAAPWPPREVGAFRVDFTAGWPGPSEVPEELKLAVKMLAAHFFENRQAVGPERVFAAPEAVDALIAPYRSMRI